MLVKHCERGSHDKDFVRHYRSWLGSLLVYERQGSSGVADGLLKRAA